MKNCWNVSRINFCLIWISYPIAFDLIPNASGSFLRISTLLLKWWWFIPWDCWLMNMDQSYARSRKSIPNFITQRIPKCVTFKCTGRSRLYHLYQMIHCFKEQNCPYSSWKRSIRRSNPFCGRNFFISSCKSLVRTCVKSWE